MNIDNYISLHDGFSPVLDKISTKASAMADKLERMKIPMGKLGDTTDTTGSKLGMLKSMFGGALLADVTMRALQGVSDALYGVVATADEYTGMITRLRLVSGSLENANYLNEQIYESAQRARGGYLDMAQAVGQLAMSAKDAFPDPREAVSFMEGINKLYSIGGTSSENRKFATIQLTQGMASGALMGDEFRSIAENAPIIENMIAKTMGVSRGELKGLASEGKITADIIKKSILDNMDEINRQFEMAPKQWGDHMTNIKNYATKAFIPVFNELKDLANSPAVLSFVDKVRTAIAGVVPVVQWIIGTFKQFSEPLGRFFDAFVGVLSSIFSIATPMISFFAGIVVGAISGVMTVLTGVFNFLRENSLVLKLAVVGLGVALAIMAANATIAAVQMGIVAAASALSTIANWAQTASTIALTWAQDGLNAALAMCPLTWIIGLVIVLIGIFYAAVAAINHFAGTSISATGIIAGTFAWLGAFIWNIILFLWNSFISFAEFIRNVFKDPLAATHNLFADIWNGIFDLVKDIINGILKLYNKIPGVTKVSLLDVQTGKIAHKDIAGGYDFSNLKANYLDPNNEASFAYNVGDKLSNDLANFGGIFGKNGNENKFGGYDASKNSIVDPHGAANEKANSKTAKNTDKIANGIEMTAEEIQELRDSALNQALQSWQESHYDIKIENNNKIDSNVDIDGVTSSFVKGLQSAINNQPERSDA